MPPPRVLVAGIGNIFLADDGFGVEVIRRLQAEGLPDGVDAADFGIRGVHLAFELAGGAHDAAILVDAAARGGPPGTVYVIEPEIEAEAADTTPLDIGDAHSLTPDAVLGWLQRLGGGPRRVFIVGCEPASIEESIGLSAPVAAAIDEAVQVVRDLARRLLGGDAGDAPDARPLLIRRGRGAD